jgi:pimeloyl-ACP methyl ester carboxylesterase
MSANKSNGSAPIILVPGFWLGAWAWDEVIESLRAAGHKVTALTLPGLDSAETDRSEIGFADHVEAIVNAVKAAGAPVVLAVHSGAGFTGYAASDQVPEKIAAMVYVDSAPGKAPMEPDFEGDERPLDWASLVEEENLDGVSDEHKEQFQKRAVPQPGGVLRGSTELTNDARRDVPTTIICTAYSSEDYQKYARETDMAWLAGVRELSNITWVDLPTSHWPMWSRPKELADLIGDVASRAETR